MIRGSLRRRLLLIVLIAAIPAFVLHIAIQVMSDIRVARAHTDADTRAIAAAAVPLLKSALIVGDLATAQETLDRIADQGAFHTLKLLDDSYRHVLAEGRSGVPVETSPAPKWFVAWLNIHFAKQTFPVTAGGTHYGTLVIEPSSLFLVVDIWERIWTAVAIWLVSLSCFALLLRLTLQRSLRPFEDLAVAAHRLGEGDLSSRVPVGNLPELAETAIAFNRMADNLAEATRKQEERVRQATRELENLIERIPAGVYKLRIAAADTMRFEFVSPRWCEIIGLDAETVARDPWAPLSQLHPDEVEGFRRAFEAVKTKPAPFYWEGRLRDEAPVRWIRIEATPTVLDNGDILWEGTQYDITATRQAGELLQSIINVVDEGLLIIDDAGHVLSANNRFRKLWNIPEEMLLTGEDERLLAFVLEQLSDPQGFLAEVHRLYPTDEVTWAVIEFKDGRVFERYTCPVLTEKGRARLWSFRDITRRRRIELDLRRLTEAVAHASEAFVVSDANLCMQYVNPSFERLFGYTLDEIRGRSTAILLPDDPAMACANPMVHGAFAGERLRRAKDGRLIPVLLQVSSIRGSDGADVGFVGTMTDLTAIKKTEAALRQTVRELDNLVARIPVGVYKLRMLAGGATRFDYVSPLWCEQLEVVADDAYLNSQTVLACIHPDEMDNFVQLNERARQSLTPFEWEGRLRDGMRIHWLHIESTPTVLDNGDILWEGIQYDITATKEREAELDRLAHYDALTGIPNRMLLADRLHQALAQAQRTGTLVAVCYLDLDDFKPVNDALGHEAGDLLLVEIARRLLAVVRGGDTVARIGGDEFVLLLLGTARMDEYDTTLNRILEAVSAPLAIGNDTVCVSASMGVALYPKDDADPDLLLRHADQAMYQAKQAGRNAFHFFDPNLEEAARRHRDMLQDIEQGMAGNQFDLYYQPKVNMRLGTVIGFEALVRWRHPDKGLMLPKEFLPLIEDNDLIVALGEWVIDRALSQLGIWRRRGIDLSVSVNIAPRQLQLDNFAERLKQRLALHADAAPDKLEIEIVESAALTDTTRVAQLIVECRKLGVSFALDDFGTGYSSLTYLKNLPAQTLKIDQSFVRDMLVDSNDLAIVEGVIGLTEIFHRQVVAEGVETTEHGTLLLNMGCELAQGYGIARPMPAEQVDAWLNEWKPDPAWGAVEGFRWPRDDLPLVIAQSNHRAWIEDIDRYVKGSSDELPELDGTRCRFGQWYSGSGQRRYSGIPEFSAIAEVHARVHILGRELVGLVAQGRRPEAQIRMAELEALRDELLMLLQRLMASAAVVL